MKIQFIIENDREPFNTQLQFNGASQIRKLEKLFISERKLTDAFYGLDINDYDFRCRFSNFQDFTEQFIEFALSSHESDEPFNVSLQTDEGNQTFQMFINQSEEGILGIQGLTPDPDLYEAMRSSRLDDLEVMIMGIAQEAWCAVSYDAHLIQVSLDADLEFARDTAPSLGLH